MAVRSFCGDFETLQGRRRESLVELLRPAAFFFDDHADGIFFEVAVGANGERMPLKFRYGGNADEDGAQDAVLEPCNGDLGFYLLCMEGLNYPSINLSIYRPTYLSIHPYISFFLRER